MVNPARVNQHQSGPSRDGYVLYWMQQAQRTEVNPALDFAIEKANDLGQPLAVVFCLVADYPEASARHFTFMFQGLAEVGEALADMGVPFAVVPGDPAQVVGALSPMISCLVMDGGYLPLQRWWRNTVVDRLDVTTYEVDTDVVVPPSLVSDKLETAARTIRPKIMSQLDAFLDRAEPATPHHAGSDRIFCHLGDTVDLADVDATIRRLAIPTHPGPVAAWTGGTSSARQRLDRFIDHVLADYDNLRNRYDIDHSTSMLSPYLHFGQISPVEIVQKVKASGAPPNHIDSFIDEIVVRRELAVNYVLHLEAHDEFAGLPGWAQSTLNRHASDERAALFSPRQLEDGETDDPIWNTTMHLIRRDGWVHNQLRMYWGKQILRWTNSPEQGFNLLLELNNRYFLDGRDPVSFANVAWCFGRHDQGFQERPIIGKVRPFTEKALKRKGDLAGWLGANQIH